MNPEPQSSPRAGEPERGNTRSRISSDDAFAAFYKDAISPAASWLIQHHPDVGRDPETTNQFVGDAFTNLYEKRHSIGNREPYMALLDELRNVVAGARVRQADALPESSGDSSVTGTTGARGILDPNARSAGSQVGSIEIRQIFSLEAVMSLTPEQRELYDLHWVQGKDPAQIADARNETAEAIKHRCQRIQKKLQEFMARYDSEVAGRTESNVPLRMRDHALRELQGLPNPMRDLLHTVFVDKLPFAQATARLRFASKEEALGVLAKGLKILGTKFGEKMPETLVAALANPWKKE
jgi:DNA-directed RNA polymerase specialized sigma24 family protein